MLRKESKTYPTLIMANKKKYQRQKHSNQSNYYFLIHEKKELETNYDFLDCKIKLERGRYLLIVFGKYNQTGVDYTYKVVYDGVTSPKVWILSPNLVMNPPHVYEDKSLCLYYPLEQPWKCGKSFLYSHTIPWVHEWILFNEIWKITGVWEHPEVNHGILPKT